jgi:hypothetical protein
MLAAVRHRAGAAEDGDPATRPCVVVLRRLLGLAALTIGAMIGFLLLDQPAHADSGSPGAIPGRPARVQVQATSDLVHNIGRTGQAPDSRSTPATGVVGAAAHHAALAPIRASRSPTQAPSGPVGGTVARFVPAVRLPAGGALASSLGLVVSIVGPAVAPLASVGGCRMVGPASPPARGVPVIGGVRLANAAGWRSGPAMHSQDDRLVSSQATNDRPADPQLPFMPDLPLTCTGTGSGTGLHVTAGYLIADIGACNAGLTRLIKPGDKRLSKRAVRPSIRPD